VKTVHRGDRSYEYLELVKVKGRREGAPACCGNLGRRDELTALPSLLDLVGAGGRARLATAPALGLNYARYPHWARHCTLGSGRRARLKGTSAATRARRATDMRALNLTCDLRK
jgi:hypothetical protein